MKAAEAGMRVLRQMAEKRLVTRAAEAVLAGTHQWVWDPEVPGVAGLVRKGTNRADVIVYLGVKVGSQRFDDFEVSDDEAWL